MNLSSFMGAAWDSTEGQLFLTADRLEEFFLNDFARQAVEQLAIRMLTQEP